MSEPNTDHFDLQGRVALVTGGSRGLGRAMSMGFARAGADVVVASRDGDACHRFAKELRAATGVRALGIGAHVGRWTDLDQLVEQVWAELGRIDILVNNAGMSPLYDSVENVSEELFDKVLGVNLKGPFRLMATVGSRMAAGEGGSIINISSAGAVHPQASHPSLRSGEGRAQRPHGRFRAHVRSQGQGQRHHGRHLLDGRQQGLGHGRLRRAGRDVRAQARRRRPRRSSGPPCTSPATCPPTPPARS